MAGQRIAVTGNCQRGGAANTLDLLLPDDRVVAVLAPEDGGLDEVRRADRWVRVGAGPLAADPFAKALDTEAPPVVPWPTLAFGAFHPDITYVRRSVGGLQRLHTEYHSAIGFWAWRRGLTAGETATLFAEETFEALGYLDAWGREEAALAKAFAGAGLDFEEFRLAARRLGVFMHTVNHPTAAALALVGHQVARAIDPSPGRAQFDEAILRYLIDYLSVIVWPVYPPIAQRLGVAGSYRWKERHASFPDLRRWLEASWQVYAGLDPAGLEPFAPADARFATLERLHG